MHPWASRGLKRRIWRLEILGTFLLGGWEVAGLVPFANQIKPKLKFQGRAELEHFTHGGLVWAPKNIHRPPFIALMLRIPGRRRDNWALHAFLLKGSQNAKVMFFWFCFLDAEITVKGVAAPELFFFFFKVLGGEKDNFIFQCNMKGSQIIKMENSI